MNTYTIPEPIMDRLDELNDLVVKNPLYIDLEQVAKFLHMNAEGLRNSIEKGWCPFGIGWQKNIRGYRSFKIPTLTFYMWYTHGATFK